MQMGAELGLEPPPHLSGLSLRVTGVTDVQLFSKQPTTVLLSLFELYVFHKGP
jgi:hypothetical protein